MIAIRFVRKIEAGQDEEATKSQKKAMKQKIYLLQKVHH